MPHDFTHLLAVLVALIVSTKVLGEVAQRLGQPSVLGELVAGVLLGRSLLGVLDPADPVITAMAEIGVLVLLFEIGLHTDLESLIEVGSAALMVALVGVALPLVLGYGAAMWLGLGTIPAIVCGAALTATSIGISARVLSDLGQLDTPEGQVVLGAAVLDDVVGLIILSVVSAVVSRVTLSALGITRVGAFAAGIVLFGIPQRQEIERATTTIGHFFVPIFFASVGAAVDLRALANAR